MVNKPNHFNAVNHKVLIKMKLSIFFSFLFFTSVVFVKANTTGQGFDKADFYAALASDKLEDINAQLTAVKGSSISEKEAYEGVLLMKKSGLVSSAKEKLSLFKAGRTKLEASISKDNGNAEYRFLRLIIQEHAPKIVKYRNELEQDSQLIRTNLKNLPQFLQQVINDYSKKSKALKNP